MCGIVGIVSRELPERAALERACSALHHRGPDADGIWTDAEAGVALGHRRLAIIDLSDAGAQPMESASGRFVIAYNGEMYNHLALREHLDVEWRGHSDTETLLAAIEAWGVEKALKDTVGMFAFALWDRAERKLILARDRFGEKPLYYGLEYGAFMFASELAALKPFPQFRPAIDRAALAQYVQYKNVPGTACIYRGFRKLQPGSWVEFTAGATTMPEPTVYWSAYDRAGAGTRSPFAFDTDEQAADQLEAVLATAVRGQMLADVPLGALLSGGVDSSTVVALMQAQSPRPVKTFSIGFDDPVYDEARHANAVAAHLGTEHTELYVTPRETLEVIPALPAMYSEPFADSSQVPTHLVCAMARRHVTVALSGDGGDELFAGYTRYRLAESLWRRTAAWPLPLRAAAARAVQAVPPSGWDRVFSTLNPVLPQRARLSLAGDKLHKGAALLAADSVEAVYQQLVSFWPPSVVLHAEPWHDARDWPAGLPTFTEQMMARDTVAYLHDDILAKVDRAAMAVSLETRVPMLDHRVYEFAWRLPLHLKLRDGQGKWLLRRVLDRHVPRALIERPKMGFGVPIYDWLKGPLKDWAEDLLAEDRLVRDGWFDAAAVRERWHEHQSGRRNWQYHLWTILMFNAWLDAN